MASLAQNLLGLTCETPLHAGGGSKESVIDLPIQKEAHSGWPCVYGSSMKGALRARADQQGIDPGLITQAFGPDTDNAGDHAGALLVSDARLLLLPVRSLTSHFKLVTCPALLRRLLSDLARMGMAREGLAIPAVNPGEAQTLSNDAATDLYLEEFRFSLASWKDADSWLALILELIAPIAGIEHDAQSASLRAQLTLVDDDSFSHLCQSALPVLPHIRIKSDTKTVADGAFWYEENLPAETLLYSVLGCQPSRKPGHPKEAAALLAEVGAALFRHNYLQIGGNETTGMGWCRVARIETVQGGAAHGEAN